jgi:hypothetical protein
MLVTTSNRLAPPRNGKNDGWPKPGLLSNVQSRARNRDAWHHTPSPFHLSASRNSIPAAVIALSTALRAALRSTAAPGNAGPIGETPAGSIRGKAALVKSGAAPSNAGKERERSKASIPKLHSLSTCQSGEQEPPQHLLLLLGSLTERVERTAPKLM